MIWTDTFASNEQKTDLFKTTLAENNKRLQALNGENIEVIIGNPPYSVGQDSANDDNRNEHYEQLDKRLAATYVAGTKSSNKNKLYDCDFFCKKKVTTFCDLNNNLGRRFWDSLYMHDMIIMSNWLH